MTEFAYIRTRVEDEIAVVELYRPDVLNALNRQMVTEIVSALEAYDRNDGVRVIVLTGSGRAFAAGADIDEMAGDDPIKLELLNQFAEWDRLALIKKPMVAAVNGFALGEDLSLPLAVI